MPKYNMKPRTVDAVLCGDAVDAATRDFKLLPEFIRVAYERGEILFLPNGIQLTDKSPLPIFIPRSHFAVYATGLGIISFTPEGFNKNYELAKE